MPKLRSLQKQWEELVSRRCKQPLVRLLVALAHWSATHPTLTIVGTILLSLCLVSIGLWTNFRIETDGDILWTPVDSNPVRHGNWIRRTSDSGFAPPSRTFNILVHAHNASVLTLERADCVFEAVERLQNMAHYQTVCGSANGDDKTAPCSITSVTTFWDHNRTAFLETVQSDDHVKTAFSKLTYPNQEPVNRFAILGHAHPSLAPQHTHQNRSGTLHDDHPEKMDTLEYASSYLVAVHLPSDRTLVADLEQTGTNVLLQELQKKWIRTASTCRIEVNTARSFDDELERGLAEDTIYMVFAFLIMGTFCSFYLGQCHCVQSQSMLGLGAIVTIIMSLMTGYGLLFIIGVPFSSITQIFPYVMVGIGLDDTFIITGAFGRTDPSLDVVDRIVLVIEEVGVSITVSTLTTVVAFFLGCTASLPGIYWFCYYAAPTVLIDFLYQITFFVAILVYDDRRIKANRYDCLVCFKSKTQSGQDEETRNETANVGNIVDGDVADMCETSNEVDVDDCSVERPGVQPPAERDNLNDSAQNSYTHQFMDKYSDLLLKPLSKVCVLVFFSGLAAIGIYGALQQRQEMDFRDLTPVDSFVRTFFDAAYTYASARNTGYLQAYAYFRNVDFASRDIQEQMEDYVNDIVGIPFISNQPDYFWLRDFNDFVAGNETLASMEFVDQVDVFLGTEPFDKIYRNDIVRDKNGVMTASRCSVVFDKSSLFDVQVQIDSIQTQRKVTEAQPINNGKSDWHFFMMGQLFYGWELYSVIIVEILNTVVFGLVSVFVLSIIFIPHPIGALLLTPVVALIYCELVAFLYVAGIYINGVSAIGLVMSVGLVVDYNMHTVLTYYETTGDMTRDERVKKVLTTMGTSIMIGGFSTFLGVLPLSFTRSEVFLTFFYSFLAIPTLGVAHGLVFVPVVLSLIGPHKKSVPPKVPQSDEGGGEKEIAERIRGFREERLDL